MDHQAQPPQRGPQPPHAPASLEALARRLRGLPPSCGPVRLVGVDGHAGSGKSTFAGHLAAALGGPPAPVVHLDDLATHDELFAWQDRFREQVLVPLAAGGTARYRRYDWVLRRFPDPQEHGGTAQLPPAHVVIVEGVGAGRRALRPYLACLLWLDVAPYASWERGRRRDGPGLAAFWDGWVAAEKEHFASDPSRPYADLLVRQGPQGFGRYVLVPGPATTA